jgi:hypothetical protein
MQHLVLKEKTVILQRPLENIYAALLMTDETKL